MATPRHFVPDEVQAEAYENRALALKQEADAWISSISQPSMIAIMLEQLEVRSGIEGVGNWRWLRALAQLMAHLVGESERHHIGY
ncbi:MAG: hypothetical protein R2911_35430 [Caldilineaceae bacterium]